MEEGIPQPQQQRGLVESLMCWARFKQIEQNQKNNLKPFSRIKGVPKLEDANEAGTENSHLCTLILTEGDSAKSLAVAGLGVIGRDHFGVFPLRGKMLNVREATQKQIMENSEINSLMKTVGLHYHLKYENEEDFQSLRYGKIMIMADQDQDGSHVKGLLVNFIHCNWPVLMKRNFVEEFITPIVKAISKTDTKFFYSIPECIQWRQSNPELSQCYFIKYYKGLGTSTAKEAREYFSNMLRHRIPFHYYGIEDDNAVELAFSKKKIEERKEWLTNWMENRKRRRLQGHFEDYLYDKQTNHVTFSDFINKELILFSNADNERSIPSLVDGLKPGQRKVLYTCFKRNDRKEVKVAQLAGAVGEATAYHHGEASLMMTIINLAQDFVGSNNINLLLPIGQFGTRLQGGKDSASPRYIFTKLNPVTRTLFPSVDDNVLRFLYEENQKIEPEWYCPIIPMVLVNGAEGIGTGWSTKVPNYNPRDIVENIRRLIKGQPMIQMFPWYRKFTGSIVQLEACRFVCSGEISRLSETELEITELPLRTWTQSYKETVIEPLLDGIDGKSIPLINDFKEYHTDQIVKFIIEMFPDRLRQAESDGLHKTFKLQSVINTNSMVLFDANGCLRKYFSPEDICLEWFEVRKQIYIQRKEWIEGMLRAQTHKLAEQARFLLFKIDNGIRLEDQPREMILEQLIQARFPPDPVRRWRAEKRRERESRGEECGYGPEASTSAMKQDDLSDIDPYDQFDDSDDEDACRPKPKTKIKDERFADYNYLIGMTMWKLSREEKEQLLIRSQTKQQQLAEFSAKSWSDLWETDLDNFLRALAKQEQKEKEEAEYWCNVNCTGIYRTDMTHIPTRVIPTMEKYEPKMKKPKKE